MSETMTIKSILASETSKSQKIRDLQSIGVSRWDTSKLLGIKYQFVRNVLVRAEDKAKRAADKAATAAK